MQQRTDPLSWLEVENVPLSVDCFPDGSFRFSCDLENVRYSTSVGPRFDVTLKSTLPEALHACFQVCSALLDNFNKSYICLSIETFPDQRADRDEKVGMAIPVIATCTFLAQMPVDEIIIHDIHNKSILKALETSCEYSGIKVHHVEPIDCLIDTLYTVWPDEYTPRFDFVVAVDKGAIGRAEQVRDHFASEVIYADKKRVDGVVVGHEILSATATVREDDTIWIVDDLCDGGATFISIAKLLRETYKFGDLNLYVTHGLFSKGKEELFKHYDHILAHFDSTGA